MKGPVAALDLGTNTFLMLVTDGSGSGALDVRLDLCRTPRLGHGLAASGEISESAMQRGLETLREFRERLSRLDSPPRRVRAVGTAALRRARNANEFIRRAREESGFEVEVLPEDEEARLGYFAVAAEGAGPDTWIIDVGGGSTEIVGAGGSSRVSAPIGAVVLTERWLGTRSDAAFDDSAWRGVLDDVRNALARLPSLPQRARDADVVALGGTGANVAVLELGLPSFEPARTEGALVSLERVASWAERLRLLRADERRAWPIEPERAAILPAGLACLAGALAHIGAPGARVSGRGLRYGLARELLSGFGSS